MATVECQNDLQDFVFVACPKCDRRYLENAYCPLCKIGFTPKKENLRIVGGAIACPFCTNKLEIPIDTKQFTVTVAEYEGLPDSKGPRVHGPYYPEKSPLKATILLVALGLWFYLLVTNIAYGIIGAGIAYGAITVGNIWAYNANKMMIRLRSRSVEYIPYVPESEETQDNRSAAFWEAFLFTGSLAIVLTLIGIFMAKGGE